jgi:hypothetical protein
MSARTRVIALLAMCFTSTYFGSYALLYSHRSPAANLSYFVYFKGGTHTDLERAGYYLYYPIYRTHRLFGATRHNYDRPQPKFPVGFNG